MVRTFDAPEALGNPVLRGPGPLGDQRGPEALADAVPLHDQSLPGMHAMRASTASPAPPTPTSTSTPARTSSARSSSRSTRPSWCAPSWRGRPGRASTWRSGTNTDPYQWVEGRYRLMEGIWEAMRDFANPCSVLTKSPLLLRDLELMQADRRADRVHRQPLDPDPRREGLASDRAAHPAPAEADRGGGGAEARRDPHGRPDRAADPGRQRLAGAGRAAPRACWRRPAPTRSAASALHLRGEVREIWFDWLREHRPDLIPRYEGLYARGRLHASARRRPGSARWSGAGTERPGRWASGGGHRARRGGRNAPEEAAAGSVSSPPGRQPRLF